MTGINAIRPCAPAFVFDWMEPERPKVDCFARSFLKSGALHPADFTIREDGVVKFNPELARLHRHMQRRVAAIRNAMRTSDDPIGEFAQRPTSSSIRQKRFIQV